MSEDIYSKVVKNKIQGMKIEREEMMVEIYESGDDFRTQTDINTNRQQPIQSTGSERGRIRSYRPATVCLVLLCVLLLTAVIVLCVLINTNNQQWHIKTKNLTEERDQLLTKYTNITEERDQLMFKCINMTKEKDKLLINNNKQIEKINELWKTLENLKDGWIYYKSSLYFNSSEQKNWNESRRYCRERGADLIIINNKEEQDFIKDHLGKGAPGHWIGLSDNDEEDRWKWVDNSTLNSKFWVPGEPNGGRRENCVESVSSGWNDLPCNTALKWICEKQF